VAPTTAERQAAAWVAALFLVGVLLQRFAIPGLPAISLLVPVVVVWAVAAMARGVVVIDSTRLTWWLAVASSTGFLMLIQSHAVMGSSISFNAWALLLVIWLPFVLRLVNGGIPAYLMMLRYVANIATALGAASVAMMGIQLAGVSYHDWFGQVVPEPLQLADFNTAYPIEFGSSLYRSNAFVGLEPSIVSSLLGVGVLAGMLAGVRAWKLAVMVAGLIATLAGSGMIIVLIGIVAMSFAPRYRRSAFRNAAALAVVAALGSFTEFGGLVFQRVFEFRSDDSSTSLRVREPYRALLPEWTRHAAGTLLGYGPGSSQRTISETSIEGVLVTTPIKIFFEYGIVGGLLLAGFVLICYWGGPSRTLSVSLLISIWLLQAGLASVIIMMPVLLTVTLWSPRIGEPIESIPLQRNAIPDQIPTPVDAVERVFAASPA
jgi:hypothetical protein